MSQQEFKLILNEIAQRAKARFSSELHATVLFGSYARGDYEPDSDIDIALLFTCPRSEVNRHLDDMVEIATDLGLKYGVVISFIGIPQEEYEQWLPALPFYQNIEREGVRLIA